MKFSDVLDLFDVSQVSACEIHDKTAEILNVQFLLNDFSGLLPETIYIISTDDITRIPVTLDFTTNFVMINPSRHNLLIPPLKTCNYLVLDDNMESYRICNLINDYLGAEMKMHQTMSDLSSTLFKNRGLQSILDAACNSLHNPLFVVDPSGAKMAYSLGNTVPKPDSNLSEFLSEHHEFNHHDSVLQKYFSQLNERLRAENKPILFYNEHLQCNEMIAFVRVREVEIGHVFMLSMEHDFTRFDEMIFDRLVALIGQELQKNPLYTKNFHDVKAHFLHNLLSISNFSTYTINRMQKIMDITFPHQKFCVVTVEQQNRTGEDHALETLSSQYSSHFPYHISLIYNNAYILLLNVDNREEIYAATFAELKKMADTNRLLVGISNLYDDIAKTYKHYQQALEVIYILRRFPGDNVSYFSHMAPMYLFDIVQENTDLVDCCVPELLDLLAEDQEYHTELMLTLYLYLENFGNVAKTASQLFIHRNTLLYRMNKIREILHNNLENGEILFHLMLSFRILQRLLIYNPTLITPKNGQEQPPESI